MIESIIKYPKTYRQGHKYVKIILSQPVYIQEKVDGSNTQILKDENGIIHVGKRSHEMSLDDGKEFVEKEGLFSSFIKFVKSIDWDFLPNNIVLYGECTKGKQIGKTGRYKAVNTDYKMKFSFILFDILNIEENIWLNPFSKPYQEIINNLMNQSKDINFVVTNQYNNFKEVDVKGCLLKQSEFDPVKQVEGIVIKQYNPRATMKIKNEEFKEFKEPKKSDLDSLIEAVLTDERIKKKKQEINYKDKKQFGELIKVIAKDIFEEERNFLMEESWKHFKKKFGKEIVSALREKI